MKGKFLYYKYPSTWVKLQLFKSDLLFYFNCQRGFEDRKILFHVQTPVFHIQRDKFNFVIGPSFFLVAIINIVSLEAKKS